MPKLKDKDELKSTGRIRRKENRILGRIDQTPAGRFSICKKCGERFEQVWKPKHGCYTQYETCGRCRSENANRKSTEIAPYTPHPKQQLVHDSPARFKLLCAGTRFGKDRCMVMEFIQKFALMLSEKDRDKTLVPRVYGWIIAPTFALARQNWRELKTYFPQRWIKKTYESDKIIETVGDGIIEVRSANDAELLVGVGLDILLLTEAGKINDLEDVWINLETRLMSPGRGPGGKGGIGLINGTPSGRNFYYTMFQWGQKDSPLYRRDWESWQFPSFENPYLKKEDYDYFEDIRTHFPERRYRQEILAEFIAEGNCVFPDCDSEELFYDGPTDPQPGETYVIGYDPAKSVDYAAVVVRNSQGDVVKAELWSGLPFTQQVERVVNLSRLYNFARVVMDRTALGETLPEAFTQRGVEIEAIKYSNELKNTHVNHLAFLIEQRAIRYPKNEQLIAQLKDYEYKTTKTGLTTYGNSVKGGHDDFVTAMYLAFKDYQLPEITIPYMGLLAGVPKNMRLM